MEQFFRAVLPPEREKSGYYIVLKRDKNTRHIRINNLNDFCNEINKLVKTKVDVYYALAAYAPKYRDEKGRVRYRTHKQVLSLKALWWDIDLKEGAYSSKRAAAEAVASFCRRHKLPRPFLVDSGGGLHVYWPLRESVDRERWLRLAHGLRALRQAAGVAADPAREIDPASILRPPGTVNHKYDPPRPVRLLTVPSAVWAAEQWEEVLPEPPVPRRLEVPSDDLSAGLWTDAPVDAGLVADACLALGEMRRTGGRVSEPHWRAMLGLLKYCENGRKLAHEWSKDDERYDPEALDDRWERWEGGPTTCAYIETVFEGCQKCRHRGKVTTPLQLGRKAPPEAENPKPTKVNGKLVIPPLPKGFTFDEKTERTIYWAKNKDGGQTPVPVLHGRIFAIKRWVDEFDQSVVDYGLIRTEGGKTKVHRLTLKTEAIGVGGADLKKELGKYEVYPAMPTGESFTSFTHLIREEANRLRREKEAKLRFTQFGWKPQGGFLLGTTLYTADGPLPGQTVEHDDRAEALNPRGELATWQDAVSFILQRGMEPYQYAMACSFGSILGVFMPKIYKGIPLALTGGGSGQGKTTACQLALTVWGDPVPLTLASEAGSTKMARSALLGTYQNIPLLIDEVTNIEPHELSQLLYALSYGCDRLRLNRKGEMRHVLTWNTITYLTANTDLVYLAHRRKLNAQAEMMRLVEINMDSQDIPRLDPVAVDNAVEEAIDNAGNAGAVFVDYVVRNKDKVSKLTKQVALKVSKAHRLFEEPRYRFWRYQISAALAGASLAKSLGLVNFNVDMLFKWLIKELTKRENYIKKELGYSLEEQLASLMRALQGHTLVTAAWSLETGAPQTSIVPVRGEVYARWVTDAKEGDPLSNAISISIRFIKDWCAENRLHYPAFLAKLKKANLLLGQCDNINLCRGTVYVGMAESVLVFDPKMLKMHAARPITMQVINKVNKELQAGV